MTTAVFVEENAILQTKRTRKAHHKVRTGCLTCKARRKKCDEKKPFCNRCVSTGRKCDGYIIDTPSSTTTSNDATDLSLKSPSDLSECHLIQRKPTNPVGSYNDRFLKLWRPPRSTVFGSDEDFYCFDFFRVRTGPEFAAYFDSSIWRTFMVRACFQHPTVLQAATAVGAVHRRFELGLSREAFEYCDISMKLYHKALKSLHQTQQNGDSNGPEISMIVSILLSIFETFQANYESALAHFSAGLKQLLNRKLQKTHSQSKYKTVEVNYTSLRKFFSYIEYHSTSLFKVPVLGLDELRSDISSPIPQAFTSITQARDVIFAETKAIWHTWDLLSCGALPNDFSTQHNHISRLLEWSMAYAEYSKNDSSRPTMNTKRPAQLLKVYREAAYLLLLTQMAFHDPNGVIIVPLCQPPEICDCHSSCRTFAERRAALNAHFARILILAECIFDPDSFFAYEEHSLSVDSGIGPPLYMGATRCRSTKVRHQVTSLLAESELQTKVWDALGVYTIAEKLSSIEEHAVVACGIIPRELEPKWVDITCFLEEGRILLRHCRAADNTVWGGSGLIWTQEWISFDHSRIPGAMG